MRFNIFIFLILIMFTNFNKANAYCYIDVPAFMSSCSQNGYDTFVVYCPYNEYPDGRNPVPSVRPMIGCNSNTVDQSNPKGACPSLSNMRENVCSNDYPNQITEPVFPDNNKKACGSIIDVDNQSVSEAINLIGVPFQLYYSSSRSLGRKDLYETKVPLSESSFTNSSNMNSLIGRILVSGQSLSVSKSPSASLSHNFIWDGKDQNGNSVEGTVSATVQVEADYSYPTCVVPNYSAGTWFTLNSSSLWHSCNYKLKNQIESHVLVGSIFSQVSGGISSAGGWDFNVHHQYDPVRRILYKGDGTEYNTSAINRSNGEIWIVSKDRSEIYVFTGKYHTSTKNAVTNQTEISFSYNSSNKLISLTDKYGNLTSIQYSNGVPVSITGPYGHIYPISVDSNGFINSISNSSNTENYSMTYSSLGLLLTFEKPNGVISTFVYDSSGRLISDVSSAGPSINLTSSGFNNSKSFSETSELDRIINSSTTYGQFIYTRTSNSPNGSKINYSENILHKDQTFSQSGMPTVKTTYNDDFVRFPGTKKLNDYFFSNGGVSSTSYFSENVTLSNPSDPFSFSNLITSWTTNNKTSQTTYTPSSKTFVELSPMNKSKTTILNLLGDVDSIQYGNLSPVEVNYNTNGNISSIVHGSRTSSISYNSDGNISVVENALGEESSFSYDGNGRLTSQTLPDLRVINYDYDSDGNLVSISPPSRPPHEMNYNGMGFLSSYVPPTVSAPTLNVTTYSYSDDRELLAIQRPNGNTISFNYNVNGNLDSISLPSGFRSFGYTNGVVNTISSEDGHSIYPSISGSKITSQYVSSVAGLSYTYLQSFNSDHLKSSESLYLGVSSISNNFNYDNDGFLTSAGSETLTRNTTTGFLTKITQGNIERNYTYSSGYGELSSLDATYSTSNLYSQSFTRDALGRILTMTQQYGSSTADVYGYIYDSAGRLTDVTLNGNPYSEYNYDSNSNRTSQTINGVTTTATYNDQDTILTFGTKTFSKNLNGEIISVTDSATSQTTNYSYDVFGNLKQATLPSKTINYKVDGYSRRVAKYNGTTLVEQYVWNPDDQLIAVTDSSNNVVQTFVYGSKSHSPDYMVFGGVTYQIVTNHLGSPVVVVNTSSGTVSQEIVYDEFGKVLSDSNPGFQPFGFAGCLFDQDTKLCKFGARDYDPSIGRWLSKDPIRFGGGDTNLYGYVFNDPINFIDPSGKFGIPGAISGFVSGVIGGYATGGIDGAIVGGVVGAAVGAINPFASSTAGSFAGGIVSSLLGQVTGNAMDGNPLLSIDPALALASGFGSATGTMLSNGFKITSPYVDGLFGAAGEALFGIPTQMMSPGPTNFGSCGGKR